MKNSSFIRYILVVAILALSACATTPEPVVVEEKPAEIVVEQAAVAPEPEPAPAVTQVEVAPEPEPVVPPSSREIRFEYDSSDISAEFAALIDEHAAFLSQHADQSLTLVGHADERGSDEYNQSLGQQRADAIREALVARGVRAEQLVTQSLGEKQPKVKASGEEAWKANRRTAFVYSEQSSGVAENQDASKQMFVSDN
ncbi:MAG: OmpA family protein [Gammaproteobacteria bacterium]|nr:OmpA family protein [Gammaproteobacteria bacterium]